MRAACRSNCRSGSSASWSIAGYRRSAARLGGRLPGATAAHATVTFNDTSSCRFIESGPVKSMLYGVPMVGGPHEVPIEREQQAGGTVLRTSHDGYADLFNVVHHRVIMLAPDGQKLDGEDTFVPAKGETFFRPTTTSSRCASICIRPSGRAGSRTAAAPCW